MADPFQFFIDPLREIFSDPQTSQFRESGTATGFYSSLAVALSETGYSEEELREAAERLKRQPRDSREGRSFPTFAACLAACEEARKLIEARKNAATRARMAGRLSAKEEAAREQFADDALGKPLARVAALEGWVTAYRDFCEREARLPTPAEVEKIKLARKEQLTAVNSAENVEGIGGLIAKRVHQVMQNREKMLREKVLRQATIAECLPLPSEMGRHSRSTQKPSHG